MLLVALAIILNYCGRGVVRRAAQPQDALGLCRVAIDTGKLVVLLVVVSARLHHVSQLVGLCHRGAYHVAIVAERRRIAPLTDGVGLLHGVERDVLLALWNQCRWREQLVERIRLGRAVAVLPGGVV